MFLKFRRKITIGKIFFLNCIFIFAFLFYYNNGSSHQHFNIFGDYETTAVEPDLLILNNHNNGSARIPKILFWTPFFDRYNFSGYDLYPELFRSCSSNCLFTFNKRQLANAQAVVFHIRDLPKDRLPSYHAPDQIWIYYLLESPYHTHLDLRLYSDIFNWTMTYRMDSDIYHPYGRVIPRENIKTELKIPEKMNKSVFVSWIVSNCNTPSKRENYIVELTKHIPGFLEFGNRFDSRKSKTLYILNIGGVGGTVVDVYGKCRGGLECPGNFSDCFRALGQKYKFYLSFENSLCSDYVTEKFFEPLKYNLVPVVYGSGNYTSLAPPGSYIDSADFASPKHLAQYLHFLHESPSEYAKYFEWKKYYRMGESQGWCTLCQKLSNLSNLKNKSKNVGKTWSNLELWWNSVEIFRNNQSHHIPACHNPHLNDNLLHVILRYLKGWNNNN